MSYSDEELRYITATLPQLPINSYFTIEEKSNSILQNVNLGPTINNPKDYEDFVRDFLLHNGFAISNPLSPYQEDLFMILTSEGRRLKIAGSYESYQNTLKQEQRKHTWDRRKSNVNLAVSIAAGVAGVWALVLQLSSSPGKVEGAHDSKVTEGRNRTYNDTSSALVLTPPDSSARDTVTKKHRSKVSAKKDRLKNRDVH